jgi:DNA invertase Pin-like site-specific DNA recombinase
MVINEYDTETLDLHRLNVTQKEAALEAAKRDRDEFVRSLLAKGAKPTELGRAAGLSRERVYQIKEHRR